MFVLPCLGVFFLCPCGTIYNSKAPHGLRELSALAEGIVDVAAVPVAVVAVPVLAVTGALDGGSSTQPPKPAVKPARPGEAEILHENKHPAKP